MCTWGISIAASLGEANSSSLWKPPWESCGFLSLPLSIHTGIIPPAAYPSLIHTGYASEPLCRQSTNHYI